MPDIRILIPFILVFFITVGIMIKIDQCFENDFITAFGYLFGIGLLIGFWYLLKWVLDKKTK